jgi:hypothetical protein
MAETIFCTHNMQLCQQLLPSTQLMQLAQLCVASTLKVSTVPAATVVVHANKEGAKAQLPLTGVWHQCETSRWFRSCNHISTGVDQCRNTHSTTGAAQQQIWLLLQLAHAAHLHDSEQQKLTVPMQAGIAA